MKGSLQQSFVPGHSKASTKSSASWLKRAYKRKRRRENQRNSAPLAVRTIRRSKPSR